MKNFDNLNYELLFSQKENKQVKTKKSKNNKIKFCLYIDKKTLKNFKLYCIEKEISISQEIEILINNFLNNK